LSEAGTLRGASRREFIGTAARLGAGVATASVLPLIAAGRAYGGKPRRAAGESATTESVTGDASLGAHGAAHGLLYGCAVNMNALGADAAYAALIREQCRIVVAENAMKWGALRPSLAEMLLWAQQRALRGIRRWGRMGRRTGCCMVARSI